MAVERDPFGNPVEPRSAPPARIEAPPAGEYDTTRDWSQPPEAQPASDFDTTRDWSQPPPEPPQRVSWWKRLLAPLAGIGVLASKLALLLKIPFLATVLTVFASLIGYAIIFGLPFAVIIVVSIFVHELGHVIQSLREGRKVHGMMFVPFLGAYVTHDPSESSDEAARISVAGPVAGTLFAVVLFFVSHAPLVQAAAFFGFYINLLNLIPVAFLDGNRATAPLGPLWWAGICAVLVPVALFSHSMLVWIIILFGVYSMFSRREQGWGVHPLPMEGRPNDPVSTYNRAVTAAVYVLVIAVCAIGGRATYVDRSSEVSSQFSGAVPAHVLPAAAPAGRA